MNYKPEPKWIEKIYSDDSGEDFLGLRSVQGNITDYLLPGIITITPRARYYSFYSWLLHEYENHHPAGMPLSKFIKRREQIFALANLMFDEESGFGERTAGLIGTRKLTQTLRDIGDKKMVPLNIDDYIGAASGGYSQYAGVMRSLDITKASESEEVDIDLLPKSKLLASSFEKAISETKYYKDRFSFDTASFINRNILLEYGKKCYLSSLAKAPDKTPVLDVLFGFDAKYILPDPQSLFPRLGNMSSSLGLMLDILNQAKTSFNEQDFRQCIMYGSCSDFRKYRPTPAFNHVLSHWRMFQIREYYVYAIYEIWRFFLDILRTDGPLSFDGIITNLDNINISKVTSLLKIKKNSKISELSINVLIQAIFEQSGISERDMDLGCVSFANKYKVIMNEEDMLNQIYIDETPREERLLLAFLMLITVYLRLKGISKTEKSSSWAWAKEGGARRRSMAIFMQQIDEYILEETSLLKTFEWILRDYIVAQHTITALEKWRQREVNTFHFSNDNGFYEWIKMDGNGFTASRFSQSYSMIIDLGLVDFDEIGTPDLTKMGIETLKRVVEKING